MPGQQGGLFGWTLSCYGYKCYLDPLQYMIEYYIIGSNNTFTLYAIKFYVNITLFFESNKTLFKKRTNIYKLKKHKSVLTNQTLVDFQPRGEWDLIKV